MNDGIPGDDTTEQKSENSRVGVDPLVMRGNIVATDPKIFMTKASKTSSHIAAEMADDIKEVIFRYDGAIPLALAIGVLRIVEREILDGA